MIESVPPESATVVPPVYVFVPVSVRVPEPNFLKSPVPMVIAPTEEVPALSMSKLMFPAVMPPDIVKSEPESICTSDLTDDSVIIPEITFVPAVLRIAPTSTDDTETPFPVIVMASATVMLFDNDNVTSLATDVAPAVDPSAVLLLIATTPASINVTPEYELAADNDKVLVAELFFVRVPVPEMIPDSV